MDWYRYAITTRSPTARASREDLLAAIDVLRDAVTGARTVERIPTAEHADEGALSITDDDDSEPYQEYVVLQLDGREIWRARQGSIGCGQELAGAVDRRTGRFVVAHFPDMNPDCSPDPPHAWEGQLDVLIAAQ